MISVSNEFKKAIKKPERQIKGYVEVLYDLPSQSYTPIVQIQPTYSSLEDLSNGSRVKNLYGSLDYLPLDGSYLTMDESNNENIGYISDDIADEYRFGIFGSFHYHFENPITIKGITVYTRTNIVTDYSIDTTKSDNTRIIYHGSNDKEVIQYIYDSPVEIIDVYINFDGMDDWSKKIYVEYIDLGVSQVYKNQDLIEFTVDEEVNKLVEEVPINETNITLNNMSDLFNPLNPKGIVPYLSENTLIKPFIGVLTDNSGVEYVKMGEFYFDSYTNNSDSTTTLVGKNIINQTKNMDIIQGLANHQEHNNYIDSSIPSMQDLRNTRKALIESAGIECEVNINSLVAHSIANMKSCNLLDYLKDCTAVTFGIVYANRDNKIILRNPVIPNVDVLTKNELINDAKYKKIEKINTINRKGIVFSGALTQNEYEVISYSFKLTSSPQLILVNHRNLGFGTVNFTGASSVTTKHETEFFSIFEITGTIGTTVELTATTNYDIKEKESSKIFTYKQPNEKEVLLETKTYLHNISGNFELLNGQLDYAPSYEMSFDYNGDPSLEAGDYINVETPYGYKPLFIQKNRFRFDGGLEGSIEGVE